MIVNGQSLALLTQAVNAAFNMGLMRAQPTWNAVAMEIPSVTAENIYPYLKSFGQIRKWVGDRVLQNLAQGDFRIVNEDFEQTHAIPRKAIEDDQYGLYSPIFQQTGDNVARHADKQVYDRLKAGFTALGPDGQFFFDTDHPVGKPGAEASVANFMGGSGEAWFVIDGSKPVKPLIYQPRKSFQLVTFFNPDDERVFWNKEFVWGVDGRSGSGYSPFWQLAFANKNTLDATALRATLTAMASQKDDAGEPLEVMGTHLVVSPNLWEVANDLVTKEFLGNGESNTLRGRLTVVKSARLL
jgi:phage major head subunit gpT-like protein